MPSELDASASDASIDAEVLLENDAGTPAPAPAPVVATTSAPGTNLAGGGPPDCHFASGAQRDGGWVFVVLFLVLVLAVVRHVDRHRLSEDEKRPRNLRK